MLRYVFILVGGVLSFPFHAQAEVQTEVVKLQNYMDAQASCAVYLTNMSRDYSGVGFASEEEANVAINEHRRMASNAAEKLLNLLLTQDVNGERMIYSKGDLVCLGDFCVKKREYLEAIFFMGSSRAAAEKIDRKPLTCPSGEWLPCTAAEPVDNRYYKAKDLYEMGNCSFLLP